MTDLPSGWAQATVGEVADLTDGPFGSNLKTAHYTEAGPRVIRLQNIGDGVFRDEHAHVDQARYERLIKHAVRPGDIVAASLGERAPRACLIPGWLGPAIVTADCIRVRARDGIEPGYLMWMLNSPPVRAQAASSIKGVGRPRLGLGGLKRLALPVPPEREQRRILAAVEEQLSRLAFGDASLKRALRNVGRMRRSVLRSAFDHDWPTELLVKLTDPERPICYGILKPKTTGDLVVPYVEVRSIRGGRIDHESLHRTTQKLHEEFRRSELRAGDVVLAIRGSFDRAAVVPADLEGANVSRDVARIAPTAGLEAAFLAYYLGGPQAYTYFAGAARGVGVRGVNIGDLRTMPVPVPPPSAQLRIVADVERSLSLIDSMGAEIDAALRRSTALRRSILAEAFAGQLVSQDPADEPASILLERITAARATVRAPSKPRKAHA